MIDSFIPDDNQSEFQSLVGFKINWNKVSGLIAKIWLSFNP